MIMAIPGDKRHIFVCRGLENEIYCIWKMPFLCGVLRNGVFFVYGYRKCHILFVGVSKIPLSYIWGY